MLHSPFEFFLFWFLRNSGQNEGGEIHTFKLIYEDGNATQSPLCKSFFGRIDFWRTRKYLRFRWISHALLKYHFESNRNDKNQLHKPLLRHFSHCVCFFFEFQINSTGKSFFVSVLNFLEFFSQRNWTKNQMDAINIWRREEKVNFNVRTSISPPTAINMQYVYSGIRI